jgi:8-oxo-dGTP pyrophosphatase MutT (NUDIX family)
MYDKNKVHYVVATAIVVKDGKYLITKRAGWEKAFPNRWIVPGGKLEVLDYVLREKDTPHHWYNILEDLAKKEVKEETGLEISEIGYVTSMVYIRPDKIPCLIISLFAESCSGEIKLCNALTEYAWVSLDEAKNYDLIEGTFEELEMLDRFLKERKMAQWTHRESNMSNV